MTENVSTTEKETIYKVALLIDNVVSQILYSNSSDTAKFLSNPTFVQIPDNQEVEQGFVYDGTTFSQPTA